MRNEIAFYDVETTVPFEQGQKFQVLEFAAVVVTLPALLETSVFSTLIRPSSDLMITNRSIACNGITKDDLIHAPSFSQVADSIYSMLHGRVWAGHNIARFDNMRLKEAFLEIGKPAPEPAGILDTLPLLREKFGPRAGNMKMASLASFFALGDQEHRSLADVRLNLEVLKRCATLLLLESYSPKLFADEPSADTVTSNALNSDHRAATTSKNTICQEEAASRKTLDFGLTVKTLTEVREEIKSPLVEEGGLSGSTDPLSELCSGLNSLQLRQPGPCAPFENDLHAGQSQRDLVASSTSIRNLEAFTTGDIDETFLQPKDVLPASLTAEEQPSSWGGWKTVLLHEGRPLRIFGRQMRVKFGVSDRYSFNSAGNPTFTIAVEVSGAALSIIDTCDTVAKRVVLREEALNWRPSVLKREGGVEFIRVRIRTMGSGADAEYGTRFYNKDRATGALSEKPLGRVDVAAFQDFIQPGRVLDVAFSCSIYRFHSCAGLKFVACSIIM